jgi:uncharacterized protein (DUF1697 family)
VDDRRDSSGRGVTVTTYVALLRGINLGRNNRIAMADLRKLLEDLGYDNVRTYLQSGNAVFSTPGRSVTKLERDIAARIQRDLGLDVAVLVRSGQDMEAVVRDNPYAAELTDPTKLVVAFLSAQPAKHRIDSIDPNGFLPERFQISGKHIYLWCPYGQAGSTMLGSFGDRELGVTVTIRNWRTVQNLADLAKG